MRNQGILCDAAYRRCLGVGLTVIALTLCAMVVGTGAASAAGPTCPEGSTYNKATKLCERNPSVVCPSGSTYDPSSGLCTAPPTSSSPTCPQGYSYNPDARRCYASPQDSCPEGFSPDPAYPGWCYQAHPEPITCPEGSEGVVDPVEGYICVAPAARTCPEGGTLTEGGECVADPETSATCGEGLSYDPTREACVAVPQYSCPQGYGYNTLTGKCQTAPTKATKPPKA
jgi:nitrite reductase/ring-hydroxylating ferredoxin subunit